MPRLIERNRTALRNLALGAYTLIAMTTLSDDDIPLITRAMEHYNAYLFATHICTQRKRG
jgi:hypothetical protein